MANTGLLLGHVASPALPEHHDDTVCVGRLQPDLVLVSQSLWKIAIVEVSRPLLQHTNEKCTLTHHP